MIIDWPPVPLYITFAVVATWSSVLGAELRKKDIDPKEETGLSTLRKLLQWSGIGSASHLLAYLFFACCKMLFAAHYVGLFSLIMHTLIVIAVMIFMTFMFTVSFRGSRPCDVGRSAQ